MTSNVAIVPKILVKFNPHGVYDKLHTHLNANYQDVLPNAERLFTDPTTLDELLETNQLLTMIRKIVSDEMISPYAIHTVNKTCIRPLITDAALFIEVQKARQRLSKSSLSDSISEFLQNRKPFVEISISTSHLYIDFANGPVTFLDWEKFTTTAVNVATPTTPLSAADIAAAVAGAIPAPPSATDLANAFAAAYGAAALGSASPSATSASAPASSTSPSTTSPADLSTMYLFNPNGLPADVRVRYQNKINRGLILGSTIRTPYGKGYFYHMDGLQRIILSDGTLYIVQALPNEKGLLKASVICEDDTHAGIRNWYQNFVQACHDYGFYAHPLWCFRPDHGGDRGFTIGDQKEDDLPSHLQIQISKMAHPLFRLLSKKNMFPHNSRIAGIVRACDGDGYKAIKAILFKSHPAFYDQPSTLITTYPRQREHTILEYYKLFIDFQQLRAYIADINSTLDSAAELDIFINNCKYNSYLNRVTRDERRLTSLNYKYTGQQLVETLDKFLMAPDSPARVDTNKRNSYNPVQKLNKPFRKMMMEPTAVGSIDSTEAATDDSDDPLETELYSIKVPNDHTSKEVYHVYCAAIHRINAKPSVASDMTCIVCGDKHRFDNCPVLKNTEFLRTHYIRYCQFLKRDSAAVNKAQPSETKVHFMDSEIDEAHTDSDYDTDEDFQCGRA